VAAALPILVALSACSSHDTGGALSPGATGSAPGTTARPGTVVHFVDNPLACHLLPMADVTDLIHPPAPLQVASTLQDAGIYGVHAKCHMATADGQHGATLDLYRFTDKAGAANVFKTLTVGADQVVTGLGDQAMRSFDDLFILSGSDVLKVTYLEPFDAGMQSDSHQAAVGKILIPLGKLALQGQAALPPYSPTTSTSTTVRSRTTTTKRR
jgi:hypothetical protein